MTNPNAHDWECAGCEAFENREEAPEGWFFLVRFGWKPDLLACSLACLRRVVTDPTAARFDDPFRAMTKETPK